MVKEGKTVRENKSKPKGKNTETYSDEGSKKSGEIN